MQGMRLALSREPLPFEVFRAVSVSEQEAEERYYKDTKAKLKARATRHGPLA